MNINILEEFEYQVWCALRSRDELYLQNVNRYRLIKPVGITEIKDRQELTQFFAEYGMREDYPEYPLNEFVD